MREFLMAAVAAVFLLMFAVVHGVAIWRSVKRTPGQPVTIEDPLTQSATVLSGAVVGIVCLFFGLEVPTLFLDEGMIQTIKYAYIVVYFLAGFACWLVWILRAGDILLPVRNLALSFLGIGLSIVALVFDEARNTPEPPGAPTNIIEGQQ